MGCSQKLASGSWPQAGFQTDAGRGDEPRMQEAGRPALFPMNQAHRLALQTGAHEHGLVLLLHAAAPTSAGRGGGAPHHTSCATDDVAWPPWPRGPQETRACRSACVAAPAALQRSRRRAATAAPPRGSCMRPQEPRAGPAPQRAPAGAAASAPTPQGCSARERAMLQPAAGRCSGAVLGAWFQTAWDSRSRLASRRGPQPAARQPRAWRWQRHAQRMEMIPCVSRSR
jgi:hypothetical protein